MSRAFVNEDAMGPDPRVRFPLPPADDPGYRQAVARALIQGADEGDSMAAEEATGFRFGDPRLVDEIIGLLREAREDGHERKEQLVERFLRRAGLSEEEIERI